MLIVNQEVKSNFASVIVQASESLVMEFNLFTSENSAEQIQVNTLEKPPKSCFVVPLGKCSCVSV